MSGFEVTGNSRINNAQNWNQLRRNRRQEVSKPIVEKKNSPENMGLEVEKTASVATNIEKPPVEKKGFIAKFAAGIKKASTSRDLVAERFNTGYKVESEKPEPKLEVKPEVKFDALKLNAKKFSVVSEDNMKTIEKIINPPVEKVTEQKEPANKEYNVKKGDGLAGIALNNYVDADGNRIKFKSKKEAEAFAEAIKMNNEGSIKNINQVKEGQKINLANEIKVGDKVYHLGENLAPITENPPTPPTKVKLENPTEWYPPLKLPSTETTVTLPSSQWGNIQKSQVTPVAKQSVESKESTKTSGKLKFLSPAAQALFKKSAVNKTMSAEQKLPIIQANATQEINTSDWRKIAGLPEIEN